MSIGQGNIKLTTNLPPGAGGIAVAGARNAASVSANFIEFGTNPLIHDTDVPGAFVVAFSDILAKLGVGLSVATLNTIVQSLVIFRELINQTSGGAQYAQSTNTPTIAVVNFGTGAQSGQTILELANGSFTPASAGSDIAGMVGQCFIRNNNGVMTTEKISGVVGAIVTFNAVRQTQLACLKAKQPAELGAPGGSVINEMIGVLVATMAGLSGVITTWGIKQEGADQNQLLGNTGIGGPPGAGANRLTITGDTVLLHTGTALANGAAAAAGTLLNAPIAGNPTKWITIDDNGVARRIPAW